VGSIHFPQTGGSTPGQPHEDPDLEFTYYVDGRLATRTDARGARFVHFYDALGNRVETLARPASDGSPPTLRLEDKVERIALEWDAATGELTRATAYSSDEIEVGSPPYDVEETTVAESEFAYDAFGSLLSEAQAYGEHVGEINPPSVVEYEWDFASADPLGPGSGANRSRLVEMTYPEHAGSTFRRVIGFEYGSASGDVDDLLGRITAINDVTAGPVGSGGKALAEYTYTGSGRRVETTFGYESGVGFASRMEFGRDVGSEPGYTKLDRFGRPRFYQWHDDSGTSDSVQYGAEHGFDIRDNRLYARITHRDASQDPEENTRSHLWAYDGLSRLVDASFGALNGTKDAMLAPGTGIPRACSEAWDFDRLGNWAGDGSTLPGYTLSGDIDGSGADQTVTRTHEVDQFNAILKEIIDLGETSEDEQDFVYDASGNLVFDGVGGHWYVHSPGYVDEFVCEIRRDYRHVLVGAARRQLQRGGARERRLGRRQHNPRRGRPAIRLEPLRRTPPRRHLRHVGADEPPRPPGPLPRPPRRRHPDRAHGRLRAPGGADGQSDAAAVARALRAARSEPDRTWRSRLDRLRRQRAFGRACTDRWHAAVRRRRKPL
jgi:hypothetical protein